MKYGLESQGYSAPNGHTNTSAARLVLSAQQTQLKLDEPHYRESEAIYDSPPSWHHALLCYFSLGS